MNNQQDLGCFSDFIFITQAIGIKQTVQILSMNVDDIVQTLGLLWIRPMSTTTYYGTMLKRTETNVAISINKNQKCNDVKHER